MSATEVPGSEFVPEWFTRALATAPQIGSTPVDGVEIAYRAWGEVGATGIVLVHGGGAHSRWWDHVAPLLATDRRVVAFDLSGHGDSGRREDYGVDIWKHEILGVARAAGISEPPIVIGHSMGGFVTLHAASTFGTSIAAVMTVDSPLIDVAPEERAARRGQAFGPLRVFATIEEALGRFHPVPDQATLTYVSDYVARCSIREVDGGWSWKFDRRVFTNQHLPSALRPLQCRAVQFRAEYGIHPDQPIAVLVDGSGQPAPTIDIPEAGHHVMLDHPVALITGIRSVLAAWDLARVHNGAGNDVPGHHA